MRINSNALVLIILVALVAIFFWWLKVDQAGFKDRNLLPNSIGAEDEIMVVCDDELWNDTMKVVMRKVFSSPFQGLAGSEPFYVVKHISPNDFDGRVRQFNLLVFLSPLNSKGQTSRLVKEALGEKRMHQKLVEETEYFVAQKDVWAKDQLAVFFFDRSELSLAIRMLDEKARFLEYFYKRELEKMAKSFKRVGVNTSLNQLIQEKHRVNLRLLENYSLKYDGEDYTWASRTEGDKSLNITIHNYSLDEFKADNTLLRQDSLARIYHPGTAEGSYKLVENRFKEYTPSSKFSQTISGYDCKVDRGLWRMEGAFLSGPFILYSIIDSASNRVLAIEGFAYYPNEEKRTLVREMETIISSSTLP